MSGAKRFALRRPSSQNANVRRWLPLSGVLSLALAVPVQAQRLPLPAEEQEAVEDAIRSGVDYLKRTQQNSGTWAKAGVGHPIGYAVLPGLTLLECGVPARDPLLRQTARYLRAKADKLDTTYELALGILFLDRLGDPRDKKIIQMFALRLIAGQSASGGWGYKCPVLSPQTQGELLVALRHLDPWPNLPPGIAGNPGDLDPLTRAAGDSLVEKSAGQPGAPSLSGGRLGDSFGESLSPQELAAVSPSRWRDCLGMGILDGREPEALDGDPQAEAGKQAPSTKPNRRAKGERPKSKKPYVVPERLRSLTVVQDPDLHSLADPMDKRHALIVSTTDNSNTQFAILALWTAQRYNVPMNRTLSLIVRRYVTSQNLNGSWDYDYHFGGNLKSNSSPAMTCVGLIGLAVGHGLAQRAAAGRLVRDPRILRGLIALYQTIGTPSDHPKNLPMQNLYFLWSVERVAVLYQMPRIGDKSWYRWGAQILVANQQTQGNWSGGQYPGNSSVLDTCLALLFLKRANLAKDLTSKLPFKAADLNHGIMQKQKPPPSSPAMTATTAKPTDSPKPIEKTIVAVTPSKQEAAANLLTKPLQDTTSSGSANEDSASNSGGKKKWIVISIVVFVLFAGGSVFLLLAARQRGEDEDEKKTNKPKKLKTKRKPQAAH